MLRFLGGWGLCGSFERGESHPPGCMQNGVDVFSGPQAIKKYEDMVAFTSRPEEGKAELDRAKSLLVLIKENHYSALLVHNLLNQSDKTKLRRVCIGVLKDIEKAKCSVFPALLVMARKSCVALV